MAGELLVGPSTMPWRGWISSWPGGQEQGWCPIAGAASPGAECLLCPEAVPAMASLTPSARRNPPTICRRCGCPAHPDDLCWLPQMAMAGTAGRRSRCRWSGDSAVALTASSSRVMASRPADPVRDDHRRGPCQRGDCGRGAPTTWFTTDLLQSARAVKGQLGAGCRTRRTGPKW